MTNRKEEKANKIRRSDVLYYRMLSVFALLLCMIYVVTRVTRYALLDNPFRVWIAPVLIGVFLALTITTFLWFLSRQKRNVNEFRRTFSSGFLCTLCLWIATVLALYYRVSTKRLTIYLVVTAALYFIFYLYNTEFFTFSVCAVMGAVLLSSIASATRLRHIVLAVAVVLFSALLLLLSLLARNRSVGFRLGNMKVVLFAPSYQVYPFYILAGILLAGVIMSFVLFESVMYSLVVLFAYYLIHTIISTIRMM